jgi:amidohydrolase
MNQSEHEEALIALRRDLHANPELSHCETRTASVVAERLRAVGLTPRCGIAGNGVTALLEGAHPGPSLLYRADMDALPIQEVAGRSWGSRNPGVMHACGHDVHTTIGVGLAEHLVTRRDELHGRVLFVFQPAEEAAPPPGRSIGAEQMVQEGVLNDPAVDAAFAMHVMPLLDVGLIGFPGGPVWAASDLFDIVVHGRMAHGAYPHEGADPIYCASLIVQALQQIVTRNIDARDACVISVCRVTAGTAYNIVPDRAHLQGLIRTLNDRVRATALARLREVAEQVALACGCMAEVTTVRGTYLTANHTALEHFAQATLADGLTDVRNVAFPAQMGAEDFAAFSRRVPGCYLFLGVRNEERGITHMIHTPQFDVDERCIGLGVRSMAHVLLEAGRQWQSIAPALQTTTA